MVIQRRQLKPSSNCLSSRCEVLSRVWRLGMEQPSDVVRVGSERDHQIAHIHGAAIPVQPETHLLQPHTIFHQRIGLQIVPLLTQQVAAFAHRSSLSPTKRLSCRLRQAGKKAVDSPNVLDMLYMSNLSKQCHTRIPGASDQCTQRRGKGILRLSNCLSTFHYQGLLLNTSSWYQPGLNYRSNVLISTILLMHLQIVYAWKSA